MQLCPEIPEIPLSADGTIPMGDLLLADVELAGQYRECQELHRGLVEAVRGR